MAGMSGAELKLFHQFLFQAVHVAKLKAIPRRRVVRMMNGSGFIDNKGQVGCLNKLTETGFFLKKPVFLLSSKLAGFQVIK